MRETFWEWVNRILNWGVYLNLNGYPEGYTCASLPCGKREGGKSYTLLRGIYDGTVTDTKILDKLRAHVYSNQIITDAGFSCNTLNFDRNMIMIRTAQGKFKYYPNYKRNERGRIELRGTIQAYDQEYDKKNSTGETIPLLNVVNYLKGV